jgi:hypothetical protein
MMLLVCSQVLLLSSWMERQRAMAWIEHEEEMERDGI